MLLSSRVCDNGNLATRPGSMATLQNIPATYAVSIVPGATQRDSPYHYFPPAIAVPIRSTVAWFNNPVGQPHTVTRDVPGGSNVKRSYVELRFNARNCKFFLYVRV